MSPEFDMSVFYVPQTRDYFDVYTKTISNRDFHLFLCESSLRFGSSSSLEPLVAQSGGLDIVGGVFRSTKVLFTAQKDINHPTMNAVLEEQSEVDFALRGMSDEKGMLLIAEPDTEKTSNPEKVRELIRFIYKSIPSIREKIEITVATKGNEYLGIPLEEFMANIEDVEL